MNNSNLEKTLRALNLTLEKSPLKTKTDLIAIMAVHTPMDSHVLQEVIEILSKRFEQKVLIRSVAQLSEEV